MRFCATNNAAEGFAESKEEKKADPFSQAAVGVLIFGAGITLINLNERRDAQQDILNAYCHENIVSTDTMTPVPTDFEQLHDRLVHAAGPTEAVEPWPRDEHLGVTAPGALRLKRKVEMYQWHESRREDSKTKAVSYTYSTQWTDHAEYTSDGRNPNFPSYPAVQEAGGVRMRVRNCLWIPFSEDLVNRLSFFRGADVMVEPAAMAAVGLAPLPGNRAFYTVGGTPESPTVGDVRVTYQVVPAGEYTAMGKVLSTVGLSSFRKKLSTSLLKEAPLAIPDDAHDLAKRSSGGQVTSVVIPEWVAEMTEELMLAAAPIEFAYVAPGLLSKTAAIKKHEEQCEAITKGMFIGGMVMCAMGGAMMTAPAIAVAGDAVGVGGLLAGTGVGWNTRKLAKQRLQDASSSMQAPASSGTSSETKEAGGETPSPS